MIVINFIFKNRCFTTLFTDKTFDKCLKQVLNGDIKAILFSGNNYGLSTILADKIIEAFKPDEKIFFDYQDNKNDYSMLENVRNNLTDGFFSSRKAIKVFNIKSKKGLSKDLAFLKDDNFKDKIVLFLGDEIDSKSELKTFFEKNDNIACVNLYEDDEKTAINVIEDFFQQRSIHIENEAIKRMAELLHGDRLALLCECEKMTYYCYGNSISINDVDIAIENEQYADINILIDNIIAGNCKKAISEFELIKNEDLQIIMLVRLFIKSVDVVLSLKQEVLSGIDIDTAVKSKFLFWKRIPLIKMAVNKVSVSFLENQLRIAFQTEKIAKKYGNNIAISFFERNAILYNLR